MRATIVLIAAVQFGLAGCGASDAPDCVGLHITDAWVRAAPPSTSVQAGYFRARNDGGQTVVVSAVESPDFDHVEMHETFTSNGSTSMRPVDGLRIAPGAQVEFAAGGKHLMLFNPNTSRGNADKVQLQFVCGAKHAELPVSADILRAAPAGQ